jgi:hypothetical protein
MFFDSADTARQQEKIQNMILQAEYSVEHHLSFH